MSNNGYEVFPPTPLPQAIAGLDYLTVGPGQDYVNFEDAMNGEPTESLFVFYGDVDDDGSTFDIINYKAYILMAPQSTWSLESAVFSTNTKFLVKSLFPERGKAQVDYRPSVNFQKNGVATWSNAEIEFHNVNVILSSATPFSGGNLSFTDCRIADFSSPNTFSNIEIVIIRSEFLIINGITVSGTATLTCSQSEIEATITVSNSAEVILRHCSFEGSMTLQQSTCAIDVRFCDWQYNNVCMSAVNGADIKVSESRIMATGTTSAVTLSGPVATGDPDNGFFDCLFWTEHASNPAVACTAAYANARFYGCTSRQGYDANISFEATNTSNETA